MFRRKDENPNDPSTATSSVSASTGSGAGAESTSAGSAPQSPASSVSSSGQPSGGTAYVPSTPAAPRAPSEPARPAPGTSSYRPAPIAEFNRGASRGPADAMRSPTPGASSFGVPEKSPAGTKGKGRVLTVGNDILLKGEIATCDRLVIEGRVEAKLSDVHTVEIAECGSFKGTAEVEDAEISGVFEGDLIVRNRLVIYASGEVRGNISYGEIEIERGGRMTGQIKTANSANGAKAKPFENQDKRAKETAAA